jgi:glycosyltransferase involved in cell wall biosynthesis
MNASQERAAHMAGVAYLANTFPSPVEPYVGEEIAHLRESGVPVIACSVLRSRHAREQVHADIVLFPSGPWCLLMGLWLGLRHRQQLRPVLRRAMEDRREPWLRRMKTLLHTWLGCCLAWKLRKAEVCHLHVHHGYAAAWIAMTAAMVLGGTYSMTLHGSDLLLGASYLDVKIEHCQCCFTISEYNRKVLRRLYPLVEDRKLLVQHLGVPIPVKASVRVPAEDSPSRFTLLTVGRLHTVKNHTFLLYGCALLRERGRVVHCRVAGDGTERRRLRDLRDHLNLSSEVEFLGAIPHEELGTYYDAADLVVLTSVSEGIPLTLMEAMARGALVLAPAITGIPELVADGVTGFLYRPGSLEDFASRIAWIREHYAGLGHVRHAARQHVLHSFNRELNLPRFQQRLLRQVWGYEEVQDANFVLQ